MTDGPAVQATNLSKTYGDVVALDGVSLDVATGEVFGLVGPNGAGKTTLVRALTGTTSVSGTVRLFGDPPTAVDPDRIGLLPQEFAPAARLTARELLTYFAGLYERPRDIEGVLADVGLRGSADTRYEALSGGQKRRACVGTTLVNDPDLLFLDEPTTGIDPVGRRRLWRLIERLAGQGTTVLLTSHSMSEIERLADKVGLLQSGELVAMGTPTDLIRQHAGAPRLVIGAAYDSEAPFGHAPRALRDSGFEVTDGAERLVLEDVAPGDISRVVDVLDAAEANYVSLSWAEPSLEDVYLQLTGDPFDGSRPPEVPSTRGTKARGSARGPGMTASGSDRGADLS